VPVNSSGTEFVLEKPFVGFFDVLGQIGKKHKTGSVWPLDLSYVFNFDVFTLVSRRGKFSIRGKK
jgi:hypothetical protein